MLLRWASLAAACVLVLRDPYASLDIVRRRPGAFGVGGERVPAVVIKPRSVSDACALRAKYRSRDTLAVYPAEVLLPLYGLLGDVRARYTGMAAAFDALVVAAVLLAIFAVLDAHRKSLGVLRALGAPPTFALVCAGSMLAVLPSFTALRISAHRLLRLG